MTVKFNTAIQEIIKAGGRPNFVGGTPRDKIMGITPEDFDIEVFHLDADQLIAALAKVGTPNIDDRKFGVIRLDCDLADAVEFALPRKDNVGERGFGGVFPNLSAFEAAIRRDFTFNAISEDCVTGEIIDPLNGKADLRDRVIQHCHDDYFIQDPLRAIRGFRFAGLLNADVSPITAPIVKELIPEVKKLAPSAMWSEFEKWAKRSIRPSKGLEFMVSTGLAEVFPEIEALIGCPQDSELHPEGDVFDHTCHTIDAAAGQGVVVVLAALCHDFGKVTTTQRNDQGRWVSPKHAEAGEAPTRSFLARIGAPNKIIEAVVELVREHMVCMGSGDISQRQARRLLARLENASIDNLMAVIEADHSGRPPLSKGLPERAKQLKTRCEEVEDEVKPMVLGRHLITLGMTPGKHFGNILRAAEEAQLDGAFNTVEGGIEFLKSQEMI